MKFDNSEKNLTVKQFREWLDAHEADQTEMDEEYFGKFENQLVLVWIPKQGYTPCRAEAAWEYGGPLMVALDENKEVMY